MVGSENPSLLYGYEYGCRTGVEKSCIFDLQLWDSHPSSIQCPVCGNNHLVASMHQIRRY